MRVCVRARARVCSRVCGPPRCACVRACVRACEESPILVACMRARAHAQQAHESARARSFAQDPDAGKRAYAFDVHHVRGRPETPNTRRIAIPALPQQCRTARGTSARSRRHSGAAARRCPRVHRTSSTPTAGCVHRYLPRRLDPGRGLALRAACECPACACISVRCVCVHAYVRACVGGRACMYASAHDHAG